MSDEATKVDVELEALRAECERMRRNVENLLRQVGDASQCRGCARPFFWIRTKRGRAQPYDPDGTPHHATCPQAEQFRKSAKR